jgi:hypothetical protein
MGFIKPVAATVRRVYATGSTANQATVEDALDNTVETLETLGLFPTKLLEVLSLGTVLQDESAALDALRGLAHIKGSNDLEAFPVERLGRFLYDPTPTRLQRDALSFLSKSACFGADLTPVVPVLERALDSEAEFVAYRAGGVLLAHAFVASDRGAVERLFSHGSSEVRQGAAEGLRTVVRRDLPIHDYAELIGRALEDECGGVVFHTMKALLAYVTGLQYFTGLAPLDGALPYLRRALDRPKYSVRGWVGDEPHYDPDTLRGESLAEDARIVLGRLNVQLTE